MADIEWAFPFADSNGDRVYSDADFAKFFSAWFVNGVFINVGKGLQLVDSVAGGMRITLKSGAANINGRVYYLNSDTDLTVPVASALQDRTDSVVIQLNLSARTMASVYKQGDTSVTRNNATYELQIATIKVPKNASEITSDMISDSRTNKTVCGIASPNDPIDVDKFITQFKATFNQQLTDNQNEFKIWFENLKNELDSNQAANLQNEIDSLEKALPSLAKDDEVVHKVGDEDVFGDKNFKDGVILNSISTTTLQDITQSFSGINMRFLETSLGVNVLISGGKQTTADGKWQNIGRIPAGITVPKITALINGAWGSGIGGVSLREAFSVAIRFTDSGSIDLRYQSMKANDNKTYTNSFSIDGSTCWIK